MCSSPLANSGLVASNDKDVSEASIDFKTEHDKSDITQSTKRGPSSSSKTKISGMSLIRDYYEKQGLSNVAIDLIMASWRPGMKSQYNVYLTLWVKYFKDKGIAYTPTLNVGIEFLTYLFRQGYSYRQIAMARSALSSVIVMGKAEEGVTFGKHMFVKRLLKGISEKKPVFPKFKMTWNVQTLFDYFRSLDHPDQLTLATLGKKLVLLIGIVAGGHRSQTLHAIRSTDIRILGDRCVIPIYDPIKQTRPGRHLKPLEFRVYLNDPKLCVVEHLKQYLLKTSLIRKHPQLFISYQKPHNPVSKDTLARWCKQMMALAGIDINEYSSHSSRSAASSYAKAKGLSIRDICASAGWSSENTFARYYDKEIKTTYQEPK